MLSLHSRTGDVMLPSLRVVYCVDITAVIRMANMKTNEIDSEITTRVSNL